MFRTCSGRPCPCSPRLQLPGNCRARTRRGTPSRCRTHLCRSGSSSTRYADEVQDPPSSPHRITTGRRHVALTTALFLSSLLIPAGGVPVARAGDLEQMETLEAVARAAYGSRRFDEAIVALTEIIKLAPEELQPRFREMRGDCYTDSKQFVPAIRDYRAAIAAMEDTIDKARILSQIGLALEGLDRFDEAVESYDESLKLANALGNDRDPYLLNSLGNCYASLGEWKTARMYYLESANSFQRSRSIDISMQKRLDGAIFSFSNAVLMDAQIGDMDDASIVKRMQDLARRAPGSADMRAALAAMWYGMGESERAETQWEFACNSIAVGCAKYEDLDWLRRVRRWPPSMVAKMDKFVRLAR